MKKNISKITALTMVIVILSGIISPVPVSASTADDLADQIRAIGLMAVVDSDEVTVTGTAAIQNTTLSLNIGSGVEVNWEATLTGSMRTSTTYLINLLGNGIFNLKSNGSISNTGTGGTVTVTGGLRLNIEANAQLLTATNGITLNIAANGVKVDIKGKIDNGGSNSAINVANTVTEGVEINVSADGKVLSEPSGYAINNGGTGTEINISGTVKAGPACAIRSSGNNVFININDNAQVSNSATSNTNSTIYTSGDKNDTNGITDKITISGNSVVKTEHQTSLTSYVIQTTGDVDVTGGKITAKLGRAINLIGSTSKATVTGGIVETDSGIAISTATTTPSDVPDASISISGGTVRATGAGTAVRVTGVNGNVDITGGTVSSLNGNAVMASGEKSEINISGDSRVSATIGNAVFASGVESKINISGGWVTATTGYAVSASGNNSEVNVSGGVVFAWGEDVSRVINKLGSPNTVNSNRTITDGIVIAWNTTTGEDTYFEGESIGLDARRSGNSSTTATWTSINNGEIKYNTNGTPDKFFPLNDVPLNNVTVLDKQDSSTLPTTFILIVNNGVIVSPNDNEKFAENANIGIKANEPPEGYEFGGWVVCESSSGHFTDNMDETTTFIMPASDVTIKATYVRLPPYELTIIIEGIENIKHVDRVGGEQDISAPPFDSERRMFVNWVNISGGGYFVDAFSSATTFTMPRNDAVIMAHYEYIDYNLDVVHGVDASELGQYHSGEAVTIIADPPPDGQRFAGWTSNGGGSFANRGAESTTFTMPSNNVTVTANYAPVQSYQPVPNFSPPPEPDEDDPPPSDNAPAEGTTPETTSVITVAEPEKSGSDVSRYFNTHEHTSYIQGVGENHFAPDENTTRAEAAQMFYNLLLDKNPDITRRFPDVPQDAWYAKAVNTLASIGFLSGYPDGSFRAEGSITRAEFVTIIVRVAEETYIDYEAAQFNDVSVEHWAYPYINTAVSYGWIQGYGGGRFAPDRLITRAEAVTILNRVLERHPDRSYIDNHDELVHFEDVAETHWAYYDIMEAFHPHRYRDYSDPEDWIDAD